jgi:hypothetical protein
MASGLAALVWSKNPGLSPQAVMAAIIDHVHDDVIDVQATLAAV